MCIPPDFLHQDLPGEMVPALGADKHVPSLLPTRLRTVMAAARANSSFGAGVSPAKEVLEMDQREVIRKEAGGEPGCSRQPR